MACELPSPALLGEQVYRDQFEDGRITPGTELANVFEDAELNLGERQPFFQFPTLPSPRGNGRRRSLTLSSGVPCRRLLSPPRDRARSISPVIQFTETPLRNRPVSAPIGVVVRRKHASDDSSTEGGPAEKFRAVVPDDGVVHFSARKRLALQPGASHSIIRVPSPLHDPGRHTTGTRSSDPTAVRAAWDGGAVSPGPSFAGMRRAQSMPQSVNCDPLQPIALPDIDNPNIRGDGKLCRLPTLSETQPSTMRCIAPATLDAVIAGEHDDKIEQYLIVDARFPYEYDYGHIEGAENLWTYELLLDRLFGMPIVLQGRADRLAVIFHCEFSSHRAPTALKYIRNLDRRIHLQTYPSLHLPELYLLSGGYKRFFGEFPARCTPKRYLLMVDPRFSAELLDCEKTAKRCNHNRANPAKEEEIIMALS